MINGEQAENKEQVRSWLYQLLSDLEIADNAIGEKIESPGREITIKVQLQF